MFVSIISELSRFHLIFMVVKPTEFSVNMHYTACLLTMNQVSKNIEYTNDEAINSSVDLKTDSLAAFFLQKVLFLNLHASAALCAHILYDVVYL